MTGVAITGYHVSRTGEGSEKGSDMPKVTWESEFGEAQLAPVRAEVLSKLSSALPGGETGA